MLFWRRRASRSSRNPSPATTAAGGAGAPAPSGAGGAPAVSPRFEKAVMAIAVHARQLDSRLATVEEHLSRERDLRLDYATHDDLLDLRLHSAKIAGEVARINVELRAEIERLAAAVREEADEPSRTRLQSLAEAIAELDDRLYEPALGGLVGPPGDRGDADDRYRGIPRARRVTTTTPAPAPTAAGHPAIKDAEIIDLEPTVVLDADDAAEAPAGEARSA